MKLFQLLVCLAVTTMVSGSYAQNRLSKPRFSFGYGTTYTFGKVGGKQEFMPHLESVLMTKAGFSQQWPLSAKETGLKSWENFLYSSQFYFGIEKVLRERIVFSSGLHLGGRVFTLTEYRTENSIDDKELNTDVYANRVTRGFLVSSIPFLFKVNLNPNGKLQALGIGGLVLNYAHAPGRTSIFYQSPTLNSIFPTAHVGLELKERYLNRFAIDMGWQVGFYNMLRDQVFISPALMIWQPGKNIEVESKGTHFKVGLHYYFDLPQKLKIPFLLPMRESVKSAEKEFEIELRAGAFELCLFDEQVEDGDSMTILQDEAVVEPIMGPEKLEKCYTLSLDSIVGETEVLMLALNNGKLSPNTVRVTIRQNGSEVRSMLVNTDTKRAIQFILKRKAE